MIDNIKQLEDQIREASIHYYSGQSIIPDSVFDKLLENLRNIDPNNELLTTVGFGYKPQKAKIKHKYFTGSLDKIKTSGDWKYQGLTVISAKEDGLTINVEYENGKLIRAATRGDGIFGQSCIHHVSKLLPLTIPFKDYLCVRGEGLVKRSIFETKYSKKVLGDVEGFEGERGLVAGILNNKEQTDKINDVNMKFYTVMNKGLFTTKQEMLNFISSLGLPIVEHVIVKKEEITDEYLLNIKDIDKEYLTDGLVLTPNNLNEYSEMAYKFKAESVEAEVGNIEWNMGTEGNDIPIVILKEPVKLSGAMVQRASGHNAKYIKDNEIGIGSIIEICRSNEVIPYILGIVSGSDNMNIPTHCPKCNNELQWSGVHLVCNSIMCPARQKAAIMRLLEIVGVPKGVNVTTIDKWLKLNNNDNISQFMFYYSQSALNINENYINFYNDEFKQYGKFLIELEQKIINKIRNGFSYSEFWYIINLPGLGPEMSDRMKDIDPYFVIVQNYLESNCKINITVLNSLKIYYGYWNGVKKFFKLIQSDKKETKFQIAVTGALNSMKRNDFVKLCEERGIKVGDIKKDTKYLVCNNPSNSSKFVTAQKNGTQIISEEEFLKLI